MTNPTTVFDKALAQFKGKMQWSPQTTETEKTLILGNLNGFVSILNKQLLETSDAEILAAVEPTDMAEANRILREVLERAADHIKDLDGGDQRSETGWKSDELLDVWLKARAALSSTDRS